MRIRDSQERNYRVRNRVGEGNEHWVRRARLEIHSEEEEIEESKKIHYPPPRDHRDEKARGRRG